MYKLLTQENKDLVSREYKVRRINVVLVLFIILVSLSLLALVPSIIEARAMREVAITLENSAKGVTRVSDRALLEGWVNQINANLGILEPAPSANLPYDLFVSLLKSKSADIKITNLVWQNQATGVMLRASGKASNRQALISFQENLRATLEWKQVDFPVSALAKDTDVDFDLTLIPN